MSRRLTLRPRDAHTLLLSGLDSFLSALLHEVPEAAATHPASDARLYPSPTLGQDPGADEEWGQFVRPGLEDYFAGKRSIMEADLASVRACADGSLEVDIPVAHVHSWIHSLNQARLSLAAQFDISAEEMDSGQAGEGEKGLILFRIQFYGILQEWLLEAEA